MILLDTNILVRSVDLTSSDHGDAVAALKALMDGDGELCIVPQNLYEFRATATRPILANGLGMSIEECRDEVVRQKAAYHLLADQPNLVDVWESLAVALRCHGRVAFDARLVAAMKTHSIKRILTFDLGDFSRFPDIEVLDPHAIATSQP
jgi:predicted nucleic acid-binding protein